MSESNIAYITVDMTDGQDFGTAMFQINKVKHIKPSAWFADVLHTKKQTPEALYVNKQIYSVLKGISPELSESNINVFNNLISTTLRARDMMYSLINDHKPDEVKFRDENGKQQAVEF